MTVSLSDSHQGAEHTRHPFVSRSHQVRNSTSIFACDRTHSCYQETKCSIFLPSLYLACAVPPLLHTHTHTHTYTYTHTHTHTHTYAYAYTHTYTHTHVHTQLVAIPAENKTEIKSKQNIRGDHSIRKSQDSHLCYELLQQRNIGSRHACQHHPFQTHTLLLLCPFQQLLILTSGPESGP